MALAHLIVGPTNGWTTIRYPAANNDQDARKIRALAAMTTRSYGKVLRRSSLRKPTSVRRRAYDDVCTLTCRLWSGQMRTHLISGVALRLAATSLALAQTATGVIRGSVRDSTGAVITDVHVTLVDERRNQSWDQTTNSEGFFEFRALPFGDYRLQLERPGFKKEAITDVGLEVTQTVTREVGVERLAAVAIDVLIGELLTPQVVARGESEHHRSETAQIRFPARDTHQGSGPLRRRYPTRTRRGPSTPCPGTG